MPPARRPRGADRSAVGHRRGASFGQGSRFGRAGDRARRAELRHAACRYQQDAYAAAVGRSATGQFSSKRAFLRRGVLGRRQAPSARATVSPGGTLGLDLDEIGLPEALAHVVCGARVWLKRDPVLHRWGLLPVRSPPRARRHDPAPRVAPRPARRRFRRRYGGHLRRIARRRRTDAKTRPRPSPGTRSFRRRCLSLGNSTSTGCS